MNAIEVVEKVLASRILPDSLVYVAPQGATQEELTAVCALLPRPLSFAHSTLLKRWNGLNLEMLRIFRTSGNSELQGLADAQHGPVAEIKGAIALGDNPSGFLYAEAVSGEILALDSYSGEFEAVARNLDDFFCRLVFGKDAAKFSGELWLADVQRMGLA